jgi:tetratricopeptide (TPR) repeat protein
MQIKNLKYFFWLTLVIAFNTAKSQTFKGIVSFENVNPPYTILKVIPNITGCNHTYTESDGTFQLIIGSKQSYSLDNIKFINEDEEDKKIEVFKIARYDDIVEFKLKFVNNSEPIKKNGDGSYSSNRILTGDSEKFEIKDIKGKPKLLEEPINISKSILQKKISKEESKINTLIAMGKYDSVFYSYDKIIQICRDNNLKREILLNNLINAGNIAIQKNIPLKHLTYLKQSLNFEITDLNNFEEEQLSILMKFSISNQLTEIFKLELASKYQSLILETFSTKETDGVNINHDAKTESLFMYLDSLTYYNKLSKRHETHGDYKKALKFQIRSNRLITKSLDSSHPLFLISITNLAFTAFYSEKYDEARDFKNTALKLIVGYKDSLSIIQAEVLEAISSLENIIEDPKKALEYNKRASNIFVENLGEDHKKTLLNAQNRMIIFYNIDKNEECIELAKKILPIIEKKTNIIQSDFVFLQLILALYYDKKKLPEESLKYSNKAYDYALEQWPTTFSHYKLLKKQHSRNLYWKSNKYFNQAKYEAAAFQLKKLLKLEYKYKYLERLADCYYRLGKYSECIAELRKVSNKNDLKENNWYNIIGLAFMKSRQFTEAKAVFTEYENLRHNQGMPYRNWAMYYALQNQKEEALENLEKAIAQGYKDLQWLQTDDSMENLRNEPGFKVLLEKLKE